MFLVTDVQGHDDIKLKLLSHFDEREVKKSPYESNDRLSNTDWYEKGSTEYWNICFPVLEETIDIIMKMQLNLPDWKVQNYWFQQYKKFDRHNKHYHRKCFYNCVYYVELPDGTPVTELFNHYTGETIKPDIKEGQMLIFPAIFEHWSPKNLSDERKTIISFNID